MPIPLWLVFVVFLFWLRRFVIRFRVYLRFSLYAADCCCLGLSFLRRPALLRAAKTMQITPMLRGSAALGPPSYFLGVEG